ncbi:MAG: zinc ribbon domain-containing protein [Oscillospiraceae bacterium]|nr:zinc ribbon domain-containing protein [Oscillospiraceae bacterium]
MAIEFFDKITASVSKTVKQASDGAKVLADKNRVRKDIASAENELRARFREIGERFYGENAQNPPAEYTDIFAEITALQTEISDLQKELELLTGSLTCKNCGKGFATDARFCPYCGEPVPVSEPEVVQPAARNCAACGAALADDAAFCAVCGQPTAPAQPPQPEAPAQPTAPVQNVCPKCGNALQPNDLFCGVCGTKAPGID